MVDIKEEEEKSKSEDIYNKFISKLEQNDQS